MLTEETITERVPMLKHVDFSLVSVEEGRVLIEVKHSSSIERKGGFVFGGVIAMLFDAVLGVAVLTVNDVGDQATVHLSIDFLRKAKEGSYIFEGKVVKKGRRLVFVEGEMKGKDSGKLLARAHGVWMLLG